MVHTGKIDVQCHFKYSNGVTILYREKFWMAFQIIPGERVETQGEGVQSSKGRLNIRYRCPEQVQTGNEPR